MDRKEEAKIDNISNNDSVTVNVTFECNVEKELNAIAKKAQKLIPNIFKNAGEQFEKAFSEPAQKAAKTVSKCMDEINKAVQSVNDGSKNAIEFDFEKAKLEVNELENDIKELSAAKEKLNSAVKDAAEKPEKAANEGKEKIADSSQSALDSEKDESEKEGSAFSKIFKDIGGKAASALKGIRGKIGGLVKDIGVKIGSMAGSIGSSLKNILSSGVGAAFSSFKNLLSSVVEQNASLKASFSQIGSNVQAAFMPMIQFALPAINALAQGLTYITGKIAGFTSEFFGTTVEQSAAAVASLKDTGKEAKKAATLAGIDEINNIGSSDEQQSTGVSAGFGGMGQTSISGSDILSQITQTMFQIGQTIPEFIAQAMTYIAQAIPSFVQAAATIINNFLASLNSHWEEITLAGMQIITSLLNGLVTISPMLGTTASNLIISFMQIIFESLPLLFESGMQFLSSFLEGLSQKMPELMPKMQECITTILNIVINKLPDILLSGMNILLSLINGISQALPQIMPAITKVVAEILAVITNNLPQIIQAGVNLIVSLVQGLTGSLGVIIEEAPKIIESLVEGLVTGIPILLSGAGDLVTSLIDAIMKTDWLQVGKDILASIGDGLSAGIENLVLGKSSRRSSGYSIPSFASGGIVRQPTLAIVGDNRRSPEAITPLHELYGLVRSAVAAGNQVGIQNNQQPVNFVLQVDGERIMEWVYGDNSFGRKRRALFAI